MFEYVDKQQSNTEFALYKDTHREKVALNETSALKESVNMSIQVVGTSNQLFIKGS